MSIATTNGAGDEWRDLVEQHEPALRRFIGKRMANRHLVDDAVQETYLRAIRSPNRPDGRWLRVLARRASVDVYRREPPPGPEVDPLSLVAEWAAAEHGGFPGSDEHVAAIVSRQSVRWAFARLSPRHQRLLLMRGVHDLTYDEMAQREGVSSEALTSALNRARERLRAGLQAYERGSLAAVAGWGARLRLRASRIHATVVSLPVVELAGTTLAVGLVAVASMNTTDHPATVATIAVVTAAPSEAPTPAPAAATSVVEATPGPSPTGHAPSPPGPPATRMAPVADPTTKVVVTPDESTVRITVDSDAGTGTSTTWAGATFSCSRSTVLASTCPLHDEVPGAP